MKINFGSDYPLWQLEESIQKLNQKASLLSDEKQILAIKQKIIQETQLLEQLQLAKAAIERFNAHPDNKADGCELRIKTDYINIFLCLEDLPDTFYGPLLGPSFSGKANLFHVMKSLFSLPITVPLLNNNKPTDIEKLLQTSIAQAQSNIASEAPKYSQLLQKQIRRLDVFLKVTPTDCYVREIKEHNV